MKLKKRKGSTLVLTLMVFAVLMILGTFIMGFMVTENKQSINHQNKTQAYYIARSGAVAVEAAILGMSENELKELTSKLNSGVVNVDEIDIDGEKTNVLLRMDGNKLFIESEGSVGVVSEKVTNVMVITTNSTEIVEVKTAIFSGQDMIINNGAINGDVGTNNNIKVTGWPTINGNALIMKDENITSTNTEWLKSKWSNDRNIKLSSKVIYPLSIIPNYFIDNGATRIPEFPGFNPGVNLEADLNFSSANKITIKTDRYYNEINIPDSKTLEIDASTSSINIWVENLKIYGSIKVIGDKTVQIYIKNGLDINNNNPISSSNIPSRTNVYYSGNSLRTDNSGGLYVNLYLNPSSSSIDIKNSQIYGNIYIYKGNFSTSGGEPDIIGNIYSKSGNVTTAGGEITGDIYVYNGNFIRSDYGTITGNIYINNGYIELGGSGMIKGSVLTNGNKVTLSGSGRIAEGLLYAPNASVTLSGSGSLNGAIISNTFNMSGGGTVEYMPKYIDTSLINIGSTLSTNIKYKPGYFK